MGTFKLKLSRGQRLRTVVPSVGTPIAGSDAVELNIDRTKLSKGEALTMLDRLAHLIFSLPFPMVIESPVSPLRLTYSDGSPLTYSDGVYLEYSA